MSRLIIRGPLGGAQLTDYGLRHVVLAVSPAPYSRFSSTTGPALTLYYSTVITVYNVTGNNETLVIP
jgi:hypothetical protein